MAITYKGKVRERWLSPEDKFKVIGEPSEIVVVDEVVVESIKKKRRKRAPKIIKEVKDEMFSGFDTNRTEESNFGGILD